MASFFLSQKLIYTGRLAANYEEHLHQIDETWEALAAQEKQNVNDRATLTSERAALDEERARFEEVKKLFESNISLSMSGDLDSPVEAEEKKSGAQEPQSKRSKVERRNEMPLFASGDSLRSAATSSLGYVVDFESEKKVSGLRVLCDGGASGWTVHIDGKFIKLSSEQPVKEAGSGRPGVMLQFEKKIRFRGTKCILVEALEGMVSCSTAAARGCKPVCGERGDKPTKYCARVSLILAKK